MVWKPIRFDPKWHHRFMSMAELISTWSTCKRRQCGAVIVKDKHILSTGYNGAPAGILECTSGRPCIREELKIPSGERHELCYATHAEQNAIVQAARFGVSIEGANIYIYGGSPCSLCAKLIINAKIKNVYCQEEYPDNLAIELLKEAEINLCKLGG